MPQDLSSYHIDSLWLDPEPKDRAILIAYPHPDDESFGNAGTILRYTARGVAVHYACATRGECGTVDPKLLEGHADIAALRTAELSCAADALGLAAVHFLGYRDSGMPGAADNEHPAALIRAPLEQVASRLVVIMRAVRPQVVLTFNSYGGYGHPDHIFLYAATRLAFKLAGDPSRFPEQIAAGLAPWRPSKLYYPTFSTRLMRIAIGMMGLFGRDPRRFGQNRDVDALRVMEETTPITTTIDCGERLEQNIRARQCHRSQSSGMPPYERMPRSLARRLLGTEHFTRAVPAWDGARERERDLFEGLALAADIVGSENVGHVC